MKRNLMLLPVLLLMVASCKKRQQESVDSLLTSGAWKVVANNCFMESEAAKRSVTVDLYAQLPGCVKDNLLHFNIDHTMIWEEGAQKCITSSPEELSNGMWSLYQNNTKLKMTEKGIVVDADVLSINSETLVIRFVHSLAGITYTTTTEYGR